MKALEIGVNDVLTAADRSAGAGRRGCKTQMRGKRYTDFLRNNLDQSLELAVTDQLTGLHNRRYMTGQLGALVSRAVRGGDPVSALMIDIDHFKKINDSFGHDVGDEVLREFAVRLASNVRAIDLPCRYGGEEFVVIMPDTELEDAQRIAERIRLHVAGSPFRVVRRRAAVGDHLDRRRGHRRAQATRRGAAEARRRGGLRGQGRRPQRGDRQGGLTGTARLWTSPAAART